MVPCLSPERLTSRKIFTGAIDRYGTPASVLTDNGCIYTAKHRGGKVVMQTLTEALGVTYKHSSPGLGAEHARTPSSCSSPTSTYVSSTQPPANSSANSR